MHSKPEWLKPTVILTMFPIILIWMGFEFLNSYYDTFGISIGGITDMEEYVTSFLPVAIQLYYEIPLYVSLFIFYIYFISIVSKTVFVEPRFNTLHLKEIKKEFKELKNSTFKKQKAQHRSKLWKLIPYTFLANKTSVVFLTALICHFLIPEFYSKLLNLFLCPLVFYDIVVIGINKFKPALGSGYKFYLGLILTIVSSIYTARLLGRESAKPIYLSKDIISFSYNEEFIETKNSLVLIGEPKQYIILRDTCTHTNYFYRRDEIGVIKHIPAQR